MVTYRSKKLIGHIITDGNIGGAQQHCLYVIQHLANINYNQILFVGSEGHLTNTARDLGVNVIVLPQLRNTFRPYPVLRAVFALKRHLESNHVELVHIHSSIAGVVGRLATFLSSVKNIFSVHGWSFSGQNSPIKKSISFLVEVLLAPLTDFYVFETMADSRIAERIPIIKNVQKVLIPNGVAMPFNKHSIGASKKVKFLMVARFTDQKAQEDAVLAFGRLSSSACELHFVGDGPRLEYVKSLCINDNRIYFHGSVPNAMENVCEYDCFILLSHFEGVPISLLQAMAAGLPSICYSVGGIPEVMTASVGYCITHGDIDSVSEAMIDLVNNPSTRSEMGAHAYQLIKNEYSSDIMVAKFYSLYSRIISKN